MKSAISMTPSPLTSRPAALASPPRRAKAMSSRSAGVGEAVGGAVVLVGEVVAVGGSAVLVGAAVSVIVGRVGVGGRVVAVAVRVGVGVSGAVGKTVPVGVIEIVID